MKLTGKILELGTIDKCNRMFAKDCEITYPERLPVAINYRFSDPDFVLRSDAVFMAKADINNTVESYDYLEKHGKLFVGGCYKPVEMELDDNGDTVITKAHMIGIGIFYRNVVLMNLYI